jgi:putative nucleotidyltransferase with HDIG domain
MKIRLLFVDDERRILEGLQRSLRGLREEWDMQFAGSGQEALDLLSRAPVDVLVSDMRMPGMDGAQLLAEVKRLYPQAARIILSGHSEQEYIMKSVRIAHQYLAKPCETDHLKSVVNRTCALRNLLSDDSIKRTISNIDSLPSLPSLYDEITAELQSPQASTARIGKIISQDPGMTAKILQLVNSAFFGLQRHVSNPIQAVTILGTDTVRALVLSVHIFSQFDSSRMPSLSLKALWRHSFLTGLKAKAIARKENQKQVVLDDSFMGGLLHDIGKPILSINFPERYQRAQKEASENNLPLWEAEKSALGATHAEVGAHLSGLWGIPDSIVESILFHHYPSHCPGREFGPLVSVHVSNTLDGADPTASLRSLDRDYLACLNVLDRLPAWEETCRQIDQEGEGNE